MTERDVPRRGDVYWVRLESSRGSEQSGVRPGVIVSNDVGNRSSPNVIIATMTTRDYGRRYPFPVAVSKGEGGCPRSWFINCSRLFTITKDRLGQYLGALPPERLDELDEALR
jgi:mRNA-degrading endonuclease toxin of MazEF toxin-antitoxin module